MVMVNLFLLCFDAANKKMQADLNLDVAYQIYFLVMIVYTIIGIPFTILYYWGYTRSGTATKRMLKLKDKRQTSRVPPIYQASLKATKNRFFYNSKVWFYNHYLDIKDSINDLSVYGIMNQTKWAVIIMVPVGLGRMWFAHWVVLSLSENSIIPITVYATDFEGFSTVGESITCGDVRKFN